MVNGVAIVNEARAFFKRMPKIEKTNHLLQLMEGKPVQFNVTDGKSFYLEVKEGEICISEGSVSKAYWAFSGDTRTFSAIFNGQIRMSMAVNAGKLTLFRLEKEEFGGFAPLGAIITMCQEESRRAFLALTT